MRFIKVKKLTLLLKWLLALLHYYGEIADRIISPFMIQIIFMSE